MAEEDPDEGLHVELKAIKQRIRAAMEEGVGSEYAYTEDIDVELKDIELVDVIHGQYFEVLDGAIEGNEEHAYNCNIEALENVFERVFGDFEDELSDLSDQLYGTDDQFDVDELKEALKDECVTDHSQKGEPLYSVAGKFTGKAVIQHNPNIELGLIGLADSARGRVKQHPDDSNIEVISPDAAVVETLRLFNITPDHWVREHLRFFKENSDAYEAASSEVKEALEWHLLQDYRIDLENRLAKIYPGYVICGEPLVDVSALFWEVYNHDLRDIVLNVEIDSNDVDNVWGMLNWSDSLPAKAEVLVAAYVDGSQSLTVSNVLVPAGDFTPNSDVDTNDYGTSIKLPFFEQFRACRDLFENFHAAEENRRPVDQVLRGRELSLDWAAYAGKALRLPEEDACQLVPAQQNVLPLGNDPVLTQELVRLCTNRASGHVPREQVRQLVRSGADPLWLSEDGNSLLHICARHANQEMLAFLLEEYGTTHLSRRNQDGMTPAMLCSISIDRGLNSLGMLAKAGADLELVPNDGLCRNFASNIRMRNERALNCILMSPNPDALLGAMDEGPRTALASILSCYSNISDTDRQVLQDLVMACGRTTLESTLESCAKMDPPQWSQEVWLAAQEEKLAMLQHRLLQLVCLEVDVPQTAKRPLRARLAA